MGQRLNAGGAKPVREAAFDEVGRNRSVPVDRELVVIAFGGLMRIGVGSKKGAGENLPWLV